mgnify:FL=1
MRIELEEDVSWQGKDLPQPSSTSTGAHSEDWELDARGYEKVPDVGIVAVLLEPEWEAEWDSATCIFHHTEYNKIIQYNKPDHTGSASTHRRSILSRRTVVVD